MILATLFAPRREQRSLPQKLREINWIIVLLLIAIAAIGIAMLYSVGNGSFDPWARQQAIRFGFALVLMLAIALVDIEIWMALAWPAYVGGLVLLLAVEVIGVVGMGGQRWLEIGFMRIQPSELMKIATVMALARYYHGHTAEQAGGIKSLAFSLSVIGLPMALTAVQPDLGTALMLGVGGIAVLFLAGASKWLFIGGGISALVAIPVLIGTLHDYQRQRIFTFLNPESDPLGAGYQIMQSKIALGSGGLTGKGFLGGTQSHLNFLPEMKTDFIFTVLAEEFGMLGGIVTIGLYGAVLSYALIVALTCRNQFGRLLAAGLGFTVFLYVFINIGMVMGLLPVVGVPLPMISYGGSAMLTMMTAFGLIFAVALNRRRAIPRAR